MEVKIAWPLREEAERVFSCAEKKHGGDYCSHSRNVATAAERIAAQAGMDAEKAYVFGLLHDVGRSAGWTGDRHMYDGYMMMKALGYTDVARICITHAFMVQDINATVGRWDTTQEEKAFMDRFLQNTVYDDYDRLIQLCDALGDKDGLCILEKRMVDVSMRHGLHPCTLERWEKTFELKAYFDSLCGCSIYRLLPEIERSIYA